MRTATLLLIFLPMLANGQVNEFIKLSSIKGDTLSMMGFDIPVANSDEDHKFVWELEKNGDIVETYMEPGSNSNLMILLPEPGEYSIIRKTYYFGGNVRNEESNRIFFSYFPAHQIE